MQLEWQLQTFDQLTTQQLYDILILRQNAFHLEQNCIYDDLDGKDQKALHLSGRLDNSLVAYSRIFAANIIIDDAVTFGRVSIDKAYRGQGLGRQLIAKTIEVCQQQWPHTPIDISGQYYLLDFYQQHGFTAYGDSYDDAGIKHIRLRSN